MAISKNNLLDALGRYRYAQKIVDGDAYAAKSELKNYIRTVKTSSSGTQFLNGDGDIVCELAAGAGVSIATDDEVSEMLNEIFGGK